jgi:hypothetical protein
MDLLSVGTFVRSHRLGLSLFGVVTACAIIVPACGPDVTKATSLTWEWRAEDNGPALTEIRAGQSVYFHASATNQDGEHIQEISQLSLAPADLAVASITGTGSLLDHLTAKSPLNVASQTVTLSASFDKGVSPGTVIKNGTWTVTIRTRIDNIVLSPSSPTLTVGQTLQLLPAVAIAPVSPQTAPTITYNITQQSGAITISPTGLVTAVAPTAQGTTAQITASAEGITSAPISISVNAALAPSSATISSVTTGNVSVGATRQFTFKVLDQFGNQLNQFTTAAWTSSNTAIATVSNGGATPGLATCVTPGTATISAVPTGTSLRADATLTCTAAPPVATSMAIVVTSTPSTGSVFVGQTRQYAVEVRDQNNALMTPNTAPTWSFLPATTVASISASGLVTCLTPGTPTVHAVGPLNGSGVALTADIALTCAANSGNPFASILLTPRVVTVAAGGTTQVTASFLDAGGQPTANGCTVNMTVFASPVASISLNGLVATVTGVGAGTTTMNAFCTSGGSTTTLARVQVTQPPFNVAFMLLDTHIYLASSSTANNSFTFTATGRDASNTVVSGAPITWAIQGGNTAAYAIDQTGKVTVTPSVAAGFRGGAVITASSGGQKDYGWFTYGDAGVIRGTVSSTSGQDIAPTTVVATNTSTFDQTFSPVSVNGRFFLVGLQPGTYSVEVRSNTPGRPTQTITGITVTAGSTSVITVTPYP